MRTTFFCIICILINSCLQAQCPEKVTFESNAEIIEFQNAYPNCNVINEVLLMHSVSDFDLIASTFDTIFQMEIMNTEIRFLDISKYEELGQLVISNNHSLDSVVIRVTRDFCVINIQDNQNLKKITSDVKSAHLYYVTNNFIPSPASIEFLNVNDSCIIREFDVSGNFVFTGKKIKITEELEFYNNSVTSSFEALNFDIDSIDYAKFFSMPKFNFIGVDQFNKIGRLSINNIPALSIEDFSEAQIDFDGISISSCTNLSNLFPFRNCKTASLSAKNLKLLSSIDGIVFKDTVRSLVLNNNAILVDIKAVNVIDTMALELNELQLINNPNLTHCDYPILCKTIAEQPTKTIISGNLLNCETIEDLQKSCLVNVTQTLTDQIEFTNYNHYGSLTHCDNCYYRIADISGRMIELSNYSGKISFDHLPVGLYFLHIIQNDVQKSFKFFHH